MKNLKVKSLQGNKDLQKLIEAFRAEIKHYEYLRDQGVLDKDKTEGKIIGLNFALCYIHNAQDEGEIYAYNMEDNSDEE